MKKKKIIISIIMILLGIVLLIYLINDTQKNNKEENKLIGKWTTDGVTIYTFNEDKTGTLKVSLGEYDFNYKIEEDNKLFIDFKDEKSEDTKYIYSFKDKKLILKSTNGTFNFTKTK